MFTESIIIHKIEELIKSLMPNVEIEEITNDTYIATIGLGIDSVNLIKLIVLIEDNFGFEFDDEMLDKDKLRKISDIVNIIQQKVV